MSDGELTSGASCTIGQLFSGDRRVVIPDMQRDYCWPSRVNETNNKDLVTCFVTEILDKFDKDKSQEMKMGLIYAYQSPENHIQLCDGQQRITTLYLLVGVLAKRLKNDSKSYAKAVDMLISEFELKKDDHEPRLQYAVRESTLMFLRDLVYCYFGAGSFSVDEDIKHADWFFGEYEQDPTIGNIIKAIATIEGLLDGRQDCEGILNFMADKISFLYYDLRDRHHGEEQFVVINTTGKSLTKSENRKPDILGKIKTDEDVKRCSDLWESWEQYFWEHRSEQEKGDPSYIVDGALEEFFRWVYIIAKVDEEKDNEHIQEVGNGGVFDISDIDGSSVGIVDTLDLFFNAYKRIPSEFVIKGRDQIDYFKFLPVLLYAQNNAGADEREIIRCARFFYSKAKNSTISRNPKDYLPASISFISFLNTKKETDLANICAYEGFDRRLIDDEDKIKFEILLNSEDRDSVEDLFWKEENHPILNGSIMLLLNWSRKDQKKAASKENFDYAEFKSVAEKFELIFRRDDKNGGYSKDVFRRVLISNKAREYPYQGSFGYGDWDWRAIISNNEELVGSIIGKTDVQDIESTLKTQISYCSGNKFSEFVDNDYLLEYCDKKHIRWDDSQGWQLIKTTGWGQPFSVQNEHLYQYLSKDGFGEEWEVNRFINIDSCVYIQNARCNIVFDIRFCRSPAEQGQNNGWNIELFRRNGQSLSGCIKEFGVLRKSGWEEKKRELSFSRDIPYSEDRESDFREIRETVKTVIDDCLVLN